MDIDPQKIGPREFYSHMVCAITPRPIAWVSTISVDGVPNLAPYSFFNGAGANPPAIMFCATTPRGGGQKDTLRNILATRQFVVNVVSNALAAQMNATSAELPPDASEFSHVSPPLTPLPSKLVRPPRVAESPIALECELFQVVPVGEGPMSGNVVIGRIVSMHVDDAVLTGGAIDPAKLDTIGRMGGNFYSRTRDRFALERPS